MKKLSIIRHAKSDWSHNLPDMDRPISQRGRNDADVMSNVIKDLNLEPQIIFSSPATRTIQTYQRLKKNISSFSKISFIKSKMLYDFSGYNVLEFIHSIDDKYSNVMIFSHNNSCSFLTAELGLSYIHVPTCGLLIFDFDVSLWSQVSVGKFNHYFPKSFR